MWKKTEASDLQADFYNRMLFSLRSPFILEFSCPILLTEFRRFLNVQKYYLRTRI